MCWCLLSVCRFASFISSGVGKTTQTIPHKSLFWTLQQRSCIRSLVLWGNRSREREKGRERYAYQLLIIQLQCFISRIWRRSFSQHWLCVLWSSRGGSRRSPNLWTLNLWIWWSNKLLSTHIVSHSRGWRMKPLLSCNNSKPTSKNREGGVERESDRDNTAC